MTGAGIIIIVATAIISFTCYKLKSRSQYPSEISPTVGGDVHQGQDVSVYVSIPVNMEAESVLGARLATEG